MIKKDGLEMRVSVPRKHTSKSQIFPMRRLAAALLRESRDENPFCEHLKTKLADRMEKFEAKFITEVP